MTVPPDDPDTTNPKTRRRYTANYGSTAWIVVVLAIVALAILGFVMLTGGDTDVDVVDETNAPIVEETAPPEEPAVEAPATETAPAEEAPATETAPPAEEPAVEAPATTEEAPAQ